jgi:nucleoid DNA-binding protein
MYVPRTLASIIADKADVDVDVAMNVLETMCLHIIESVKEDKDVSFTNFLKFKRSTRKARTFMPPKATKEVVIGERFAMTVRVMPKMKLILNPDDDALITKASMKPVTKASKKSSDDGDIDVVSKRAKRDSDFDELVISKRKNIVIDEDSDGEDAV